MPSVGSGPGKTAPKLLQDFLQFDPLRSPPNSNYLTDFTPPVGDGPQLSPPQGGCKHDYTPKWSQSVPPPLDSKPRAGDEYKIAAICKKCRIHADVYIYYQYAVNPCPNEDYPLHHFQRHPHADHSSHTRIEYAWLCSAGECGALLKIAYRRAKLDAADKDLLTDTEKLRRRYEAVLADDPEREGLRQATPIEALGRLRRYIKDALNPEHTKRTFPGNNKRFMEAFGVYGQDCAGLLNKLGFTYADQQWTLPQPPVLDNRLRASGESHREWLEDVEMELVAWTSKLASETGAINPFAGEGWPSADRDIERLLAAQGYTRHISLRRSGVSNEELPYFASLGALPDFADTLIEFAHDRQSLCDPQKRAYYFECLQVIAEHRNTEQLQMKVATLASQDQISRRDLSAAYRALQIPLSEVPSTSDDRVLNLYHVLISDVGQAAQEDARQALYKIGVARGSQQLIKAAQQTMETYEDALAWLGNGVDKTTSDDMLLSVVAIKTSDNKDSEENAQKAISIIANERNSATLFQWLRTGQSDGYQMTPEEALRHLGVDGNFSEIDQTVLPAAFEYARQDRPGEQTDKAIAVLQEAISGGKSQLHRPETWPVGLESHGNTCYLNSLLQYYFSVGPLRDIVLNYDDYKIDTSKHPEKKGVRVNGLYVSAIEIKGSQRFAEELKLLFERMIKSPHSKVKPEQDLVCRAFLRAKDFQLLLDPVKEENAASEGQVNGIENAIDDNATVDEENASGKPDDRHQSDASSVTLQGEPNEDEGADVAMKDAGLPPTPPDSGGEDKGEKPPLPPRRRLSTVTVLAAAQTKAAQQQDVADVHENVLSRLRAGMMSKGQDDSEEQQDAIRDLFKLVFTKTPVDNNDVEGTPEQYFDTSVQLGTFTEDTDLYSMLDSHMDLQQADQGADKKKGSQIYKSIRSLPPVLQINIPRVIESIDSNGNYKSYKSTACIKLEDELYLDRYSEQGGSEVLRKRRACWAWRRQLHALRKEQKALSSRVADLDGPGVVIEAATYVDSLSEVNRELSSIGMDGIDFDTGLPSMLVSDAEEQKDRLASLDEEIKKLEAQLKDQFHEKAIKYRLAAVMFHRGNSSHGHYWTCIHDFENGLWRKYNDETVEEFPKVGDILEARTWEHGTPTYAVYVQDDRKSDLIRPVCRAPEKRSTPEPSGSVAPESVAPGWEDVTMQNGESQAAEPRNIDPQLTVKEGGERSWDEQREVAQVEWGPVFNDNGLVKFVKLKNTSQESPVVGEESGQTSPKRRHDSLSAEHDAHNTKHVRLTSIADGEGEAEARAVERLVEGIDDAQLETGKK